MERLHTDKTQEKRGRTVANGFPQHQEAKASATQMVDNRPEGIAQKKLMVLGDNRPETNQMKALQVGVYSSEKVKQAVQLQPLTEHHATSPYAAQRVVIQLQDDDTSDSETGPENQKSDSEEEPEDQSAGSDEQHEVFANLVSEAGSEAQISKFAEVVSDIEQQRRVFAQINKAHQAYLISDVVQLIEKIGLAHLDVALALVEKTGTKGSITDIRNFYEIASAVKDNSDAPTAVLEFLNDIDFNTISELNHFVGEIGKYCTLEETKLLWEKAKPKGNITELMALFQNTSIRVNFASDIAKISTAFLNKTGQSTEADWGKIFQITGCEPQQLIELSEAFDKNDGNLKVEHWVKTAEENPGLITKPDELRATARLNDFAGEDWYKKQTPQNSSKEKAEKKYTQLLYALLGNTDLDVPEEKTFENIKGDFLSMLIFFHRHIAPFKADSGQGFDRDGLDGGKYVRSDKNHPLNVHYKELLGAETTVGSLLQPINKPLLDLQELGLGSKINTFNKKIVPPKIIDTPNYKYTEGTISVSSAGLPSHNLKILQDQQLIVKHAKDTDKAKKILFAYPQGIKPEESRPVADNSDITETLIKGQKDLLSGKLGSDTSYTNFHDGLLADRGKLVKAMSDAINSISGGTEVLQAIGSEEHPSLILKVPMTKKMTTKKDKKTRKKIQREEAEYSYGQIKKTNTKEILPEIAKDFNDAPGQEIKITERGSFGFQRPTIADTGDSVRLWPGYAPVESLLPGLEAVVGKLRNKQSGVDLTDIDNLKKLETDSATPVLYLEALKTAMRHAFVALNQKIDPGAKDEKKRVYEWLKTRLLIKIKQSGILLEKGEALYNGGSSIEQTEKNKHFAITADMTDKLQEYTMLYTAATLKDTTNPNQNLSETGKFKDINDTYEKNAITKLGAVDYRVFYLDSGEQALVVAGILANRFEKKKDENDKDVEKSKYISRNPYFEIGVFKGDERSNLVKDDDGKIVHADLSPVITSGIDKPKPKNETYDEIKKTWQDDNGAVKESGIIPIIDITNSSIADVVNLGNMPDNFIIVESLTKHTQLGADKFIMGRLIAVSKNKGTEGMNALKKENFLDLAQKIVGPVANDAYNPLLAQIRANMDKALYSDEID